MLVWSVTIFVISPLIGWYGLPKLFHWNDVKWVGLPQGWVYKDEHWTKQR